MTVARDIHLLSLNTTVINVGIHYGCLMYEKRGLF